VLLENKVVVGLGPNPNGSGLHGTPDLTLLGCAGLIRLLLALDSDTSRVTLQVAIDSHGEISRQDALALVTTNIERLLGLDTTHRSDMVAYKGGNWNQMESKVVAVVRYTGTVEQM